MTILEQMRAVADQENARAREIWGERGVLNASPDVIHRLASEGHTPFGIHKITRVHINTVKRILRNDT